MRPFKNIRFPSFLLFLSYSVADPDPLKNWIRIQIFNAAGSVCDFLKIRFSFFLLFPSYSVADPLKKLDPGPNFDKAGSVCESFKTSGFQPLCFSFLIVSRIRMRDPDFQNKKKPDPTCASSAAAPDPDMTYFSGKYSLKMDSDPTCENNRVLDFQT